MSKLPILVNLQLLSVHVLLVFLFTDIVNALGGDYLVTYGLNITEQILS